MPSPSRHAGTGDQVSVAVDIGGTFTDVTLVDRSTGRHWSAKTPSTPRDPSQGFVTGIGKVLAASALDPGGVGHVFHGTTVATNAILEGKGALAALLTTQGFRHVLEIGRHDIPRRVDMFSWIKPPRAIPPGRIFEIPGRLDADGRELVPLDEAAVRAAARRIRTLGCEAVAISFIHAYADPGHERRAREIVLAEHPGAMVSLSSEVLPTFREYERSMATILNAYVTPIVSTYVARLAGRLTEIGVKGRLLLMKSSGGVTGVESIRRMPIHTALSGPAAGVVGATLAGRMAGHANLISIDIGGTSADICLIREGVPNVTSEGKVGGWPVELPMIDIHTIGAGGGSIARVTPSGGLSVGPASAGAEPGPACYGKGGLEPTVTDAHVVLGHMPSALLGGELAFDRNAAHAAIEERVARPLGLGVREAARGILDVLDNNMMGAIRVVSVERGHDPRDFALLAFGGAGPLHAASLARLLGIPVVVVPPAPGVLSSLGLLVASLRNEFSRTCFQKPPQYDLDALAAAFAALEAQAKDWLVGEGIPPSGATIEWKASLRYRHQGFELTVPWPARAVTAATVEQTVAGFHRLHERLYTFAQDDTPVEIVTLRVDAVGDLPKPAFPKIAAGGNAADALVGRQPVHVEGGTVDCPLYERGRLGAGATIPGPAIVQQFDSTTLVLPGQEGTVDDYGNILIRERP